MATNPNADDYAARRLGMFFPGSSNGTMDDGDLTGQCVSLVKWFGAEMCQLPNPGAARGNAKDFGNTLVNQGLAYEVAPNQRQQGDLVVWPQDGGGYGHIGVLLSGDRVFEQNVALPGSSARVVAGNTVYSSRIDPFHANWRRGGVRVYRMRNYVGNRPAVSDEQIKQAYREVLERDADEGGIAHYKSQIAKGWTIDQVRQDLLNSNEHTQLISGKQAEAERRAQEAEARREAAEKARQAEAEAKARQEAENKAREAEDAKKRAEEEAKKTNNAGQEDKKMTEKPAPSAGLSKEEFEKMKEDNKFTELEGWKPTIPDNVRLVVYLMGVVGIPVTVMTMSLLAVFGVTSYELSNQVSTIVASAVGTIASALGISHFTRGK